MKTKEEILAWLDKQPWKGEFFEAIFLCENSKRSYDANFLIRAFFWGETVQGETIWSERNKEYQKWYNSTDKPTSWKEYCEQNYVQETDWFITDNCRIIPLVRKRVRDHDTDVNVMPKEHCEAFLAYMKLMQLRNAWVGDENLEELSTAYKILYQDGEFDIFRGHTSTGLSFVSKEDAKEFMSTFKDLLEVAKPLL